MSSTTQNPGLPTLDGAFARRWIAAFDASFAGLAAALADMDRRAGDGDFGTNLRSALRRAHDSIDADDPCTFADVFLSVSKGFLNTGGTSGPLFGMWFREIAKATSGSPVDTSDLAAGVATGLATVQRLGAAEVGDNTMVDAIAPAATVLTTAGTDDSLSEVLAATARAAADGARSTRDLTAGRGRSSYVGESARGVLDPGAVAVAMFFAAARTALDGASPDTSWVTGQ